MHLHRSCFRPIAVLYEGLFSIGVNGDFPTYYSTAPISSNCIYVRQNSKSPRDSTKCEDHFDTYFYWSVVYALSADRERTTDVNDELFHSRFHGYYDLRCRDESSLRGDG